MNMSDDAKFYALVTSTLFMVALGTVAYQYMEGFGWLNSLYFSVITLTTVGYGDFSPVTDIGKIFTIFYILVGFGIMLAFITVFADRIISRRASKISARKHTENK